MDTARIEAIEYTDAVCSTAWGAEPLLRLLDWRHGHHLTWRKVMGGLVGNAATGKEDWDRVSAAGPMRAYWKRVWALTGMPYPNPMHLMLQFTDPMGAAVKAAELQGQDVAHAVLRRFREQIFIFGLGPQTPDEFEAATQGVPGLDQARWRDAAADRLKAVGAVVMGEAAPRLPNTLCIATPGFPADVQVMALDLAGVMVSAGAACSSGKVKASPVLEAMGQGELSGCAIRVSGGWNSSQADWIRFVEAWFEAHARHAARHRQPAAAGA